MAFLQTRDALQLILFVLCLVTATPLLGRLLCRIFTRGRGNGGPIEAGIYRLSGIDPTVAMDWREYSLALLIFNCLGIAAVFFILLFQSSLPLNPQNLPNVPWHLAFNTAVSFVTNTNWQSYTGEATMSSFSQMGALAVQNFMSAAVGLAVLLALVRGIVGRQTHDLGNFWVDITRSTLYLFLPLCLLYALFLVSEGVIQTFAPAMTVTTLEGAKQTIPLGPVASQVAIKMLGTNGGGFFNANAAHPFENPTPLSNFIQMLSIFLIPAALTYAYGTMTKARRHGWTLFGSMLVVFLFLTLASLWFETSANPVFGASLLEGKETRFGIFNSILFSTITTSASCGAVNAMHASLSPLSGGIAILNMLFGEVIFGGVGAGLYGMLLFVLLTVFLAGLMVGRTPEYMGKKIEAREMKFVLLAILAPCFIVLFATAISVVLPAALSSLGNGGPHGLSEMFYAFTSAAANNGSAFAGLNANTVYLNLALALTMLVGRFAIIFPVLAIAGSLAQKKYAPPSAGTFATDTPIFAILLICVIVIVGALTFLPALSLGPIVEHFLMLKSQTF
jgi:potassium-transporting ATPase potassium-binding subunit